MAHMLRELVNVGELAARRMSGAKQRIDQSGEPVRFADDHRGVFAHVLFGQLARQQLRRAAQTTERIFDLVRELPNHQPAAVDLRQQRCLARNALMLSRVADLDQHGGRCRLFVRRDHAIDDQLALAVHRPQRQLAAQEWTRSLERALDNRIELGGRREQFFERPAAGLIAADAEQGFRGDVEIENRARTIDDQHAGAQAVEDASWIGHGARGGERRRQRGHR
jgi:hypothetical protein